MAKKIKQYYECHVTMLGNKEDIQPHVLKKKWKFSAIDGDPTLGNGIKCYATRHFNAKLEPEVILNKLMNVADYLETQEKIEVIRRKIELVIYDDRSSTVRCSGGCVECHCDDLVSND